MNLNKEKEWEEVVEEKNKKRKGEKKEIIVYSELSL